MQNVTIYKMNNLNYEGKRQVDVAELAEKHQQKIDEIKESMRQDETQESLS